MLEKVTVAQLGARRHYAVPRALHMAGILEAFHTDVFLSETMANRVGHIGRKTPILSALTRLAGRSAPDLPEELVRSYTWLMIRSRVWRRLVSGPKDETNRWVSLGEQFATEVSRNINSRKTNVFAFTSAARELFQSNKALGGRNILDQATAPRKQEVELIQREARTFSSWTKRPEEKSYLAAYHARQIEELELADLVLCASTFAKKLVEAEGVNPQKIQVVPLGIEPSGYYSRPAERHDKENLRVLFVGDDGLRKGIGYLDQAVRKLSSGHVKVRVIGNLGLNSRGERSLTERMELFGGLPRSAVRSHFEWAHVLVLPSVSDTFGLVILEALSVGVPVVATNHTCAPDVVREGVDGFVIPIRDSDALADKLERLASDPTRLGEMSNSALERAREFTLDKYGERLVTAINSVCGTNRL